MMNIVKPKYVIPLHGEQKHLMKHSMLASQMGVSEDNVVIAGNGNVIEITNGSIKISETVPAGRILVDGLGVGDVGSIVLRDRKHLSDDGIIVVAVSIDRITREVVSGPEVISRGFVYVKESEELMRELNELVCDVLEKCYISNLRDWTAIKTKIKDSVAKFLYSKTISVTPDAQGRVMLSSALIEYAGIEKNVAIIGCGDHAQIWAEVAWHDGEESLDTTEMQQLLIELGL